MEWTRQITSEFIELYKEKICLWKVKDESYLNRHLKRLAYEDLVNFLKSKNFTNITVKDVKTKIQNLRSAFRKESKKIEDSNRSGSGIDNIYSPSLWYYNLLLFTKDQDTPLPLLDNAVSPTSEGEIVEVLIDTSADVSRNMLNSPEFKQREFSTESRKRKISCDSDLTNFMKACTTTLSTPTIQDEYEATCISFAAKMRKMDTQQQILAESLMHRVITQGLLKKLNEHIDIVDVREFRRHSLPYKTESWQQSDNVVHTPMASPTGMLSSTSSAKITALPTTDH